MVIPQLQNLEDKTSINYLIREELREKLQSEFGLEIRVEEIELTKTQDEKFGDLTTNIALKVSKELGKNPREIAEEIVKSINQQIDNEIKNSINKIEIAGPGFINFTLSKEYLLKNLEEILEKKENYGKWDLGKNKQVMVEFGQPNTHKAMTAGHIKSGVTGLSVAKIFENLGYDVIQANYYSDIGLNSAKCTWAFMHKGEPADFDSWDLDDKMQYIAECYVFGHKTFKEDEKVAEEIREINKRNYAKEDSEGYRIYIKLRDISKKHQDEVFESLGIKFDREYPESEVSEDGVKIVKENLGKIFVEDKGAIIFEGEKYGLNRWVFINSLGLPTYSGKDLGLAYKKLHEYPLEFSLVLTSVEQTNYFKAVIKALELIDEKFIGKYFHIGYGWLLRDNKKMSSKSGNGVSVKGLFEDAYKFAREKISESKNFTQEEIKNIVEKVVLAGLKFLFLSREFHIDINYDPKQFMNPEGFSGPYILYSYVRAKSILRQADGSFEFQISNYELNSDELQLLKLLNQYPQIALGAGKNLSPHFIAFYLFDLAQSFNKFYKENKVLGESEEVENFRLSLVEATSIVLKNGLGLLGIETVEQM